MGSNKKRVNLSWLPVTLSVFVMIIAYKITEPLRALYLVDRCV